MRPPRRPGSATGVLQEVAVLHQIERASIASAVTTPVVRHVGEPHEVFAHHWSVLEWIYGNDAWSLCHDLDRSRAVDLASAVAATGAIEASGVRSRPPGSRRGPLRPLLERLDGWLGFDSAAT